MPSSARRIGARLGALARTVANLPLTASVTRRHLARHPVIGAARVLRGLPAPVRRGLATTVGRTHGPLGLLCLGAAGRRSDLAAGVRRATGSRSARRRRAAVAVAVALHEPDLAAPALDAVGPDDRARSVLAALVAAEQGHLREAIATLDGRRDRASRRLHALLAGDLAVLAPEGRDPVGPTRAPAIGGSPLTVLHLVTNALPEVVAGYTTRTHGIASAQRSAGVDAHVVTRLGFPVTAGYAAARAEVVHDGVPYHRLLPRAGLPPAVDDALAADVAATTALVRRLGADVLHAHSKYLNARVALGVRDRTGLPVVYEVRGLLEETWASRGGNTEADQYRLARESETEAICTADAVVTISDGLRDAVVDRGADPARVTVVPNSVDPRFVAEPPDATALRATLGYTPDDLVVGCLSTLNEYEGLDVLLRAVAELRRGGHPVRALLVGDGPARAALADLAADLLPGAATLTGRVPFAAAPRYHAAVDVFCVPRYDLPVTARVTPIKPLEALATGRPVVASDLAPLREIVRPGRWGALAQPGDHLALAAAIEPYLDPELRGRHGSAGRSWVLDERTWTRAGTIYQEVYQVLRSPG